MHHRHRIYIHVPIQKVLQYYKAVVLTMFEDEVDGDQGKSSSLPATYGVKKSVIMSYVARQPFSAQRESYPSFGISYGHP